MEKTISLDYTINEAQVMLEIIDIAVRARGVAAAEAVAKSTEAKPNMDGRELTVRQGGGGR